jgi:hypothetical protein
MDSKKGTVMLKTKDNWRRWFEQLRTEAMNENVWEYIDPDENKMQLEPAPAKPIKPIEPVRTAENRDEMPLLIQIWQVRCENYDREINRYEKFEKRMRKIRTYLLDTIEVEHRTEVRELSEVRNMIKYLEEKLAPKPSLEKAKLNQRYRELLSPKRGIKPKEFTRKWRELLVDMKFAKYDLVTEDAMGREFIESTEHVLPKFHDNWTTKLLNYDLGYEQDGLSKLPHISRLLNDFDVWAERTDKVHSPSRNDVAMATLDGKSDKSDQQEKYGDQKKSRKNKKIVCLDGEEH